MGRRRKKHDPGWKQRQRAAALEQSFAALTEEQETSTQARPEEAKPTKPPAVQVNFKKPKLDGFPKSDHPRKLSLERAQEYVSNFRGDRRAQQSVLEKLVMYNSERLTDEAIEFFLEKLAVLRGKDRPTTRPFEQNETRRRAS